MKIGQKMASGRLLFQALSLTGNVHILNAGTQQSINVTIYMACVNMHCTGRYQLEMVFTLLHLPLIPMGNALHGCDCIYLSL